MAKRQQLRWGLVVALSLGVGLGTSQAQTTDGNVGIGTANPQEKLHVVGNVRFACPDRCISGHSTNSVTAGVVGATIGGGGDSIVGPNRVTDNFGTVGGGSNNQAGDPADSITNQRFATVGGGRENTASRGAATVGGGVENTASGTGATVSGGTTNAASGNQATVGGGQLNQVTGELATISGGLGVPIQTWNLVSQDAAIRHMGPMAQDFAAAFGLGESERHISTVDADGVALAAIQGLYQLVQDQVVQIAALEARLAVLEAAP
jgi:hypothetical protein